MISQDSNNRPSGSPAILCDAGIPIMGRTSSTGVYEILKVNADGSLAGFPANAPDSSVAYIDSAITTTIATGTYAAGNLLASDLVVSTNISEGLYRITPFIKCVTSSVNPTITFLFIRVGSLADTYLSSLIVATDDYDPTITQIEGVEAFFHSITLKTITTVVGNFVSMSISTTPQDIFLPAGTYKLATLQHSAAGINITQPQITTGLQQMCRLA